MRFLKILLFIGLTSAVAGARAEYAENKAEAAKLAQEKVAGQVLKVERRGDKFKVKILQSSGRVVSVIINKKEAKKEQGNAS